MRVSSAMPASLAVPETVPAELPPSRKAFAAWYAIFGGYAGLVAILSQYYHERIWGDWATAGYLIAALAAWLWRSRGRDLALAVSFAAAVAGPTAWLAAKALPNSQITPDVFVVWRAASLLLSHGSPYFDTAQTAHQTAAIVYNPYLPFMAVFGLPHALGVTGLLGDTRFWTIATTLAMLALAFRVAGRRDWFRAGFFLIATPIAAFPLTVGITDPPVLGLFCLSLALLSRFRGNPRVVTAGLILGIGCAMKGTAWPALPILAVMLAYRDGARTAIRFTASAVTTIGVLTLSFAPSLLVHPLALIANTIMFPLGLTRAQTPAASPLPGHLLATHVPAGHVIALLLLVASVLAVAASLLIWPPRDCTNATLRLVIALTLIFGFSPTTRFGYFTIPIGLLAWLVLTGWVTPWGWFDRLRGWLGFGGRTVSVAPARAPAGPHENIQRSAGAG